jgi:hypothetical protein
VKAVKKHYSKPDFSFEHGAWEIDLAFNLFEAGDIYLFCININTKYLVVYKLTSKTKEEIIKCLTDLRKHHEVRSLKGDGERGFIGLGFHVDSGSYTFHNKVVDRVIRTIKGWIADYELPDHPAEALRQLVWMYNHKYHRTIDTSPYIMDKYPDLEDQYIRWCVEKLNRVEGRLDHLGYYRFKEGDKLWLYIDHAKTYNKLRVSDWNNRGVFIRYTARSKALVNAIDLVWQDKKEWITGKTIEIPLMFIKKVKVDEDWEGSKRLINEVELMRVD